MGLFLHRDTDTDALASSLADLLADPLADPFASEVVVVPAKGVERWLSQRLSHRLGAPGESMDGICAGVEFRTPFSLTSLILGTDHEDPWRPERLVWPLLDCLDASLEAPWAATLATHIGEHLEPEERALRRGRKYGVARRLASHYAHYARQRPQLLRDWSAGEASDGAGNPLPPDLRWQYELWAQVTDRIAEPTPDERQRVAKQRLRDDPHSLDLPGRLSLFGHTRMTAYEVDIVAALAEHRDVHLWLPVGSPPLYDAIAADVDGPCPREDDDSAELSHHPLLTSLGRDTRELPRTVASLGAEPTTAPEPVAEGRTVLSWLQHDLRNNSQPDIAERAARLVAPIDQSVQFHACHGPSRQVEVLREVLVGLLASDATLEPRDIVVMCPDIETYAPLIEANFGLADVIDDPHPAHELRVRLADRSLAATNPLLALASRLVELVAGRVTSQDLLEIATSDVCRRRFGFDDDDLAKIAQWIEDAAIRWGLSTEHRAAFQMSAFAQNTWEAGLDRVLLGAAMGDDRRAVGRALPVDDVGSGSVDLAGRFAEFVERVDVGVRRLMGSHPASEWMERIADAVHSIAAVDPDALWQQTQFDHELAATAQAASHAGHDSDLVLAEVGAILSAHLEGRPTRANFRTGTLTVCTMVPMRSVPHRVVCLLGLDDDAYPRQSISDGDDVLARNPMTGERDPHGEDRQLLLDAVLAATDHLVLTYTGANEQTGQSRPPSVPVTELIDATTRTASWPDGREVVTTHPLQAHATSNLVPSPDGEHQPFSFDQRALDAARAAADGCRPADSLMTPLPPLSPTDINLADLVAFLHHPVRYFLRNRLEVSSPLDPEELKEHIPVDLDGLEKWAIGDRLLDDVLHQVEPQQAMLAEQLRGSLPPGQLGVSALKAIAADVEALVNKTAPMREATRRSIDVSVDLGDGRRVVGTVASVFGNRRVTVSYSRLSAKQRIAAWVELLALTAGHEDENWWGVTVGRGKQGRPAAAYLDPIGPEALGWLRDLVDLYDRGMQAPAPLAVKTGLAYAEVSSRVRRGDSSDPDSAAAREWGRDFEQPMFPPEREDIAHRQVFGAQAPLSMLTETAADDERWDPAETHRLGQWAWRLWSPVFSRERVTYL